MIRKQNSTLPIVALLVGLSLLLYASGLAAPWYYDDFRSIVDNERIRNLSEAFSGLLSSRGVALVSFAIDYALWGLDPRYFRLTNILIHAVAAILVWRILLRVFPESGKAALGGALIFLCHPVQTQAVTYVVQRMASLAACFFLLAVLAWIKAREAGAQAPAASRGWTVLVVLAAAGAFWTKENTVVLPLVLLLVDYALAHEQRPFFWRQNLLRSWPVFLLAGVVTAQYLQIYPDFLTQRSAKTAAIDHLVSTATSAESGGAALPLRYFATQWIVVWGYVKLLLFPVGQMLDYSWTVVDRVFNWRSLTALGGWALCAAMVWRRGWWSRRLGFGLAWIGLTLAVESSFIPLDPVFEHRLYLPMVGVVIVAYDLVFARLGKRVCFPVFAVALGAFAVLTVSRNALWADPIAFWQDNQQKAPHSARVMSNLAKAHLEKGQFSPAVEWYDKALQIDPGDPLSQAGMGVALLNLGKVADARKHLETAIAVDPANAQANSSLGALLVSTGDFSQGVLLLEEAARRAPGNLTFQENLAVGYDLAGRISAAEGVYRALLSQTPDNPRLLLGLGGMLTRAGEPARGVPLLRQAVELSPEDPRAWYWYGLAAARGGDGAALQAALSRLQSLDQSYYRRLAQHSQAVGQR